MIGLNVIMSHFLDVICHFNVLQNRKAIRKANKKVRSKQISEVRKKFFLPISLVDLLRRLLILMKSNQIDHVTQIEVDKN